MRIECLNTQLTVCRAGKRQSVFDKGGGACAEAMPSGPKKAPGCVGRPTIPETDRRTGGGGWRGNSDPQSLSRNGGNWRGSNAERPVVRTPETKRDERRSYEDGWASKGRRRNEWGDAGKDPVVQSAQGNEEAKSMIPRSTIKKTKKRSRPSRPPRQKSMERGSAAPPKNEPSGEFGGEQ